MPNPQNTNALAEEDFVKVPGWDCSGALGVPPGTVVFYDPEAWEALQGVARVSKASSGGGARGSSAGAGRQGLSYNIDNTVGNARTRTTGGPSFYTPPPAFNPTASQASNNVKAERLLGDMVGLQRDTLQELRKRPAGPSGSKGQRLV